MTGNVETATKDSPVTDTPTMPFSRVVIKLSGEALMGNQPAGVDMNVVKRFAAQIRDVKNTGVEIAIVCGGGNFIRGVSQAAAGMDRATGDYMGMLGTIMNALPLQDALEQIGLESRVLSALDIHQVAEPYIRRRAIRHLERGRVVVFAGGNGDPYFTTDTTAALRALEIGADAIFMAKNGIDGVYDKDPRQFKDAEFIKNITHSEAVTRNLRVMDQTALTLCGENFMPIHVFNMDNDDAILRLTRGEHIGTRVHTPREN